MTRSRRRKLVHDSIRKGSRAALKCMPIAAVAFNSSPQAFAQEQSTSGSLQEVIVTAQKREENLQSVPMTLQALSTAKLEQMNVHGFDDYAKLVPGLTYQTTGPGYSQIIIRGVTSGGDDNLSQLQTVATYLDEQPVTTNLGTLDVHIYDIARVEVLEGPQGTLFGASSEAGTVRIITNEPDPRGFSAAYDVQGNSVAHGGDGETVEGFVNVPLSSRAALRLVAYQEHDPGFIDDVPGTRTFPTSGVCIANYSPAPAGCVTTSSLARKNYNSVDTSGGRAELKVDLDGGWTIKPVLMAQEERSRGYSGAGYSTLLPPLDVTYFYPNQARDTWVDAALTIAGKVSNLDVVYTGAFLKRDRVTYADYSDYSLAYDSSEGPFITNNAGKLINPSQLTDARWYYRNQSQEFRISSEKTNRLRFVTGLFYQRQLVDLEDNYQIPGLNQAQWVSGYPDTWWLTQEARVDEDYAAFGEVYYDILPKLTLTGGLRFYRDINSQVGFFGLSAKTDELLGTSSGEVSCFAPGGPNGAPCTNLDKEATDTGHIPKVNVAYHITDDALVYATWARGFRPGGINRNPEVPPYKADLLTSYELGWKMSWSADRVRFNGALFDEQWKDFQFAFLGANGVSQIVNAGQAEIRGLESSLEWAVNRGLTLSSGFALMNPKLTVNYCGTLDANGNPITNCAAPLAPSGTQLPGASKFKGNAIARYQFQFADLNPYVQGSLVYQTSTWSDLRLVEAGIVGKQPAYALADFAVGIGPSSYHVELFVDNAFDRLAQFSRYTECGIDACGSFGTYVIPAQPRTIGLRFGQKF
jgi:iron complex outermembrane receptor protein